MEKEDFEAKVRKFVRMLRPACSLKGESLDRFFSEVEFERIQKKKQWAMEHRAEIQRKATETPTEWAMRVFYILHLEVPENKIEVRKDDGRELTVRVYTKCPILEACKKLGLDTRTICKKVFHEPYQAFLSELDPNFHFSRNYQNIKPYTPYCEEIITFG